MSRGQRHRTSASSFPMKRRGVQRSMPLTSVPSRYPCQLFGCWTCQGLSSHFVQRCVQRSMPPTSVPTLRVKQGGVQSQCLSRLFQALLESSEVSRVQCLTRLVQASLWSNTVSRGQFLPRLLQVVLRSAANHHDLIRGPYVWTCHRSITI